MSIPRPPLSVPFLMATLAIVVLGEVLLRVPGVADRLPLPVPYYTDNVEPRRRALDTVVHHEGPVGLLFVGSSVVRSNIRPLVFDTAFAASGTQIISFNAGLSGLAPDEVRLYLEHMWLRRAQPRWVVQGVRLAELASDGRATDFRDIERARIEQAWLGTHRWSRWWAWAIGNTRLLYYRGFLSDALDRPRWPPSSTLGYAIDRRGYAEAPVRPSLEIKAYEEQDWAEKQVVAQLEALTRCAETSRVQGARFMVVNMPEHAGRYREHPALYATYLEALRHWASSHGVPLVDVTHGDQSAYHDDASFADDHHMSPAGADQFSRSLAVALRPILQGSFASDSRDP